MNLINRISILFSTTALASLALGATLFASSTEDCGYSINWDANFNGTNWSNANYACDGNPSTVTSIALYGQSDELWADHFGFSIPLLSTVQGVKVEIEGRGKMLSDINIANKAEVFLVSSGFHIGNSKYEQGGNFIATGLGPPNTIYPFGSNGDNWGATLNPAIVNSSGFGVALNLYMLPNMTTYDLDVHNFFITVYYTTPSGELRSQRRSGQTGS